MSDLEADDKRLEQLRFSQDEDIKFLIRVIDQLNRNIDDYEGEDEFVSGSPDDTSVKP